MNKTMTAERRAELFHCPFCGGRPETTTLYARCANLDCAGAAGFVRFAAWNRRAELARVAELEARLALADRLADAADEHVDNCFHVLGSPLHLAIAAYRAGKDA